MWLSKQVKALFGKEEKRERRKSAVEEVGENVPTDPSEIPHVSARVRRFLSADTTTPASLIPPSQVSPAWFEELQSAPLDFLSPFATADSELDHSFVLAEQTETDLFSTEDKQSSQSSLPSKASPQREWVSLPSALSFRPVYELVKEPPLEERVKMKRGVVGLTNPKLYCYLNASIQCLFSSKLLREYLISLIVSRPTLEHTCNLTYLLGLLAKRMFSLKTGQIHSSRLWHFIQRNFDSLRMHDAPEALCYLLNTMDAELKQESIDVGILPSSSQALAWFEGSVLSQVQCCKCGTLTATLQSFMELSLPVSPSLHNSLKHLSEVESLETGYSCRVCLQPTQAQKRLQLERLPHHLLITLLRFRAKAGKVSSFVKFPSTLKVKT